VIHKKYTPAFEARTLTPEEAQDVVHVSTFYDMPTLLNYALAFALFKTYAIVRANDISTSHKSDFFIRSWHWQPSISKILGATKEMSSKELISKRYADVSSSRYESSYTGIR